MRGVATGDGTEPLTDADRLALASAHSIVFQGEGELDVDALPPISPEDFAVVITAPNREHAGGFLAVMAMVDGDGSQAALLATVLTSLAVCALYAINKLRPPP